MKIPYIYTFDCRISLQCTVCSAMYNIEYYSVIVTQLETLV